MNAAEYTLPSEPEKLKEIIIQKDALLAEKEQRIAILEELVRLHNLKRFGASSEKSPDQQEMFNEAELTDAAEKALTEETSEAGIVIPASKPAPKTGRKPLPAELPRIRIEYDIPADEKTCPCGCERKAIGEDCSEQLDIIPAKIQVIVHARKKYACPVCEHGVKIAELPAQPIPKSNASAGTLAHIAISKYQDALPLYRQQAILQRSHIEIPRNTLANWMIKSGELIQPLINLLSDHQLSYPILHCDETTTQVLKEPEKEPTSQSYMWVRVGGPPTQPVHLFHYSPSRSGKVAQYLLEDYQGYLQTDDYAGYNTVAKQNGITQLGCWAHVRRKFKEAQKSNAPAKNSKAKNKQNPGLKNKTSKADMAIYLIAQLYCIETQIKDKTIEEKYRIRQDKAQAQLKKIREWLDKSLHGTVPKGLLGKALHYLDNNWNKLTVYIHDGRLNIDNNPAENAIRPFVIGRKNWLFSATVPGAKASANLYSLIETAKANKLEPYSYLKKVFTDLPQAKTLEETEALLPWNVKKQDGVD